MDTIYRSYYPFIVLHQYREVHYCVYRVVLCMGVQLTLCESTSVAFVVKRTVSLFVDVLDSQYKSLNDVRYNHLNDNLCGTVHYNGKWRVTLVSHLLYKRIMNNQTILQQSAELQQQIKGSLAWVPSTKSTGSTIYNVLHHYCVHGEVVWTSRMDTKNPNCLPSTALKEKVEAII